MWVNSAQKTLCLPTSAADITLRDGDAVTTACQSTPAESPSLPVINTDSTPCLQGCIWRGGVRGVWPPPQEVADPPESSAEPLWGSTLTPLRTSDSIFLLNQYIYVQLYAPLTPLFHGTNLATSMPAIVASRQSKLWPPAPSENLTNTALHVCWLVRQSPLWALCVHWQTCQPL